MTDDVPALEKLDAFRTRARTWIANNLPLLDDLDLRTNLDLQRLIFDADFAGIAFPSQFGGAGLSFEHQKAFFDEAAMSHRRTPTGFGVSIGMLAPTLLDHASEPMKMDHLPAMLRGDEKWVQLLSEPSGGSDLAGALTRLTHTDSGLLLNGSKMWSSGALEADYGLCLARSDWTVPKHKGLTMVAVPLKNTKGLTVEPIRQANGQQGEFCVEFFDNIELPTDNMIGTEGAGWLVAQSLLFHERNATSGIGHGYGLLNSAGQVGRRNTYRKVAEGARHRGVLDEPVLRQRIADSYIEATVGRFAAERVMTGMRLGVLEGQWGSLLKLHLGVSAPRMAKDALDTWGPDGVIWDGDEPISGAVGEMFLTCRGISISGGSNEIQRNIVSERLMGLPREPSFDRDLPFAEVLKRRQRF